MFAWRRLRATPGFLALAVLSLAFGIGANTAIFSVVESSLLRGLPYKDAGQLVQVNTSMPQWEIANMSAPEWLDYQRQTKALSGLAAFTSQSMTLTGANQARKLQGMSVTTNFFAVLGARAEHGRLISPAIDKPSADTRVAVISDGTWRSIFGADSKIVGRDITLNGKSLRIVGVLAPKQEYPNGYEVWISPRIAVPEQHETAGPNKDVESYGEYYLTGLGRIKRGVTLGQARAEAGLIFRQINVLHPQAKYDSPVLQPLQDTMVKQVRPALWVLLTAVLLLLLLACANLAGLLLARATGRIREFAVRLAIGASAREILRLSLAESLLLAIGGGLAGIVLAVIGLKLIAHASPYHLPAALMPELNLPVLGFCVTATLVAAFLSGWIPALHASRTDLNSGLKEGAKGSASGRTQRMRSFLVGGEIAISVMLLIGASLLLRSFVKLVSVDPGFSLNGTITARLSLPEPRYGNAQQITVFWKELLSGLSAVPGVQSVGLLNNLPMAGSKSTSLLRIEGHHYASQEDGIAVDEFAVSPDTFRAMGTPLLAGRTIGEKDTAAAPLVAVISKRFADVAFPHESPIGRRYDGGYIRGWITIVGVVGNVTHEALNQAPELDAYYSYQQFAPDASGIVMRGHPAIADLRRVVHDLDPNVPLTSIRPLGDYVEQLLATRKFLLGLLLGFSVLAIGLAGVGLYATLACSVQQRRQEIGIRVALGATSGRVLWLLLSQCLRIAVPGTVAGLLGAVWATSLLRSMLYCVTTTDLRAYVGSVVLILVASLCAALPPAVRATQVDPMNALRYE